MLRPSGGVMKKIFGPRESGKEGASRFAGGIFNKKKKPSPKMMMKKSQMGKMRGNGGMSGMDM